MSSAEVILECLYLAWFQKQNQRYEFNELNEGKTHKWILLHLYILHSRHQTQVTGCSPSLRSDSVDVQYQLVSCRLPEFAAKSRDLGRLTSNTISCEAVMLTTKLRCAPSRINRINSLKLILAFSTHSATLKTSSHSLKYKVPAFLTPDLTLPFTKRKRETLIWNEQLKTVTDEDSTAGLDKCLRSRNILVFSCKYS